MHLSQRKSPVRWGFCTIRRILPACRRRVAPLLLQFPPLAGCEVAVRGAEVAVRGAEVAVRGGEDAVQGSEVEVRGGEVTIQGGVAHKVQTTSATNANNGVLRARWSAMWAHRCLASRGARTRTPEHAR